MMKKIIYLSSLFLALTFFACNNNAKTEEEKNAATAKPLMSEHTELKAADSEADKNFAVIKVPTSVCQTCEETITAAIKAVDGVIDVKVSSKEHTAKVKIDEKKTSLQKVRAAISKAGYDADDVKRDENAYKKLPACCKHA
jgi:periplasmic mercuric ion binding protein